MLELDLELAQPQQIEKKVGFPKDPVRVCSGWMRVARGGSGGRASLLCVAAMQHVASWINACCKSTLFGACLEKTWLDVWLHVFYWVIVLMCVCVCDCMCFIESMSLCACAYVCVYASVCLYLFVYAEHGGLFHRAVAQNCSLWLSLCLRCLRCLLARGKHDPQWACKDCEWRCRQQWPGSAYACGVVRYACGAVGLWCVACVCGMHVLWYMRVMAGEWVRGLVGSRSFCIYYTQRVGGLRIFPISYTRGSFCICYTQTYTVNDSVSTHIHDSVSTHIHNSVSTHTIIYLDTHDAVSRHT